MTYLSGTLQDCTERLKAINFSELTQNDLRNLFDNKSIKKLNKLARGLCQLTAVLSLLNIEITDSNKKYLKEIVLNYYKTVFAGSYHDEPNLEYLINKLGYKGKCFNYRKLSIFDTYKGKAVLYLPDHAVLVNYIDNEYISLLDNQYVKPKGVDFFVPVCLKTFLDYTNLDHDLSIKFLSKYKSQDEKIHEIKLRREFLDQVIRKSKIGVYLLTLSNGLKQNLSTLFTNENLKRMSKIKLNQISFPASLQNILDNKKDYDTNTYTKAVCKAIVYMIKIVLKCDQKQEDEQIDIGDYLSENNAFKNCNELIVTCHNNKIPDFNNNQLKRLLSDKIGIKLNNEQTIKCMNYMKNIYNKLKIRISLK